MINEELILNKKRKEILLRLDKNEEVKDLELGMYELTPYLKDEFDSSLAEKIINIENEKNPIQHLMCNNKYLAPEQKKALEFLIDNSRCILSAPTSFGKTLIVKEYIYRQKPKNIVYIVPTNALAYELENSFKQNENFNDYDIYDRKKSLNIKESNDKKLLFIGTQEKYLEIRNETNEIDLFVIDEAYKLEESIKEQRGYRLSESFLSSVSNSKHIFLLSPNAEFEGFDKYNFVEFKSEYNPIDKVYEKVEKRDFFIKLEEKLENEKNILYSSSTANINKLYEDYFSKKKEYINIDCMRFINFLESEYHSDWNVIKFLKRNILVHHGKMPKFVQNKMIELFNKDSKYKLLIGTNSISEGINTATKNIFIDPNSIDKITKQGKKMLLKNTVGRAGRLGEYPIGYIFSTIEIEDIVESKINITLAISKDDELEEIQNSNNDNKINEMCCEYEIDKDIYLEFIRSYQISLSRFKKILKELKIDRKFIAIHELINMKNKVFETQNSYDEKICIKGVLNLYYNYNEKKVYFNNFQNKIDFFRIKTKNNIISNSEIIDKYMNFIYSTLEYEILPIVNLAKRIKEKFSNWKFGKNVYEIIDEFIKKYNKKFIELDDYENYTNEQKNIILSLKEYGIKIDRKIININMVKEIENILKIRYSTFDIINCIKNLSYNSLRYKKEFSYIRDNYLS